MVIIYKSFDDLQISRSAGYLDKNTFTTKMYIKGELGGNKLRKHLLRKGYWNYVCLFVCVEVLRPSQPNEVMSSAVSLPNRMFTGQALSVL